MQRIRKLLLIVSVMVLLMSCNLPFKILNSNGQEGSDSQNSSGSQSSSPSDSNFTNPTIKKFDGEIKIVDQWYSTVQDGYMDYGLIVENTSQKLTVTNFDQDAIVTDDSGNVIPLNNIVDGSSTSRNIQTAIFPGEKQMICTGYNIPKGSRIGNATFSLGSTIRSVDVGTQNPIKVNSVEFTEEASYQFSVGDLIGIISNPTGEVFSSPSFNAAVYDASGKLIGCGWESTNPAFIPAKSDLPVRVPLFANEKPARLDLYTAVNLQYELYDGPEYLQVSNLNFIQSETYVYPVYELTNTSSDKMIEGYLNTIILYGQNDEVLKIFSWRSQDLPAGMKAGPYRSTKLEVKAGEIVTRIVVNVHSMEVVKQETPIMAELLTFSPGNYLADTYVITTTVKNSSNIALEGLVTGACLDAAGNVVGLAEATLDLPANSETPIELIGGYLGSSVTGPNCSTAQRIEFNLIRLREK